jgi:prepilin-type N-terminal cleavage/methylation domain-containing protein
MEAMMSKPKNKQSGFTLIELLVAVMLLLIGMLGLAELQVTAMKTNAQSASSTAAKALAQRYVEIIIAWDAADPRLVDGGTGNLVSGLNIEGAGSYNVDYTISQVAGGGENVSGLFNVQVDVTSTSTSIGAFGRSANILTGGRAATATALKRAT